MTMCMVFVYTARCVHFLTVLAKIKISFSKINILTVSASDFQCLDTSFCFFNCEKTENFTPVKGYIHKFGVTKSESI